MIGLALVTCLSAFATGLLDSQSRDVERQLSADYVAVSQNGWSPLPPPVGNAIARADGVSVASSVRSERARFGRANIDVSGVDPSTIASVYRFHGADPSTLHGAEAIVRGAWAKDHHLTVGSPLADRDAGREATAAHRRRALRPGEARQPARPRADHEADVRRELRDARRRVHVRPLVGSGGARAGR